MNQKETYCTKFEMCKNSPRRRSVKKGVLKDFAIFTGKYLRWSVYLIKRDSNASAFM